MAEASAQRGPLVIDDRVPQYGDPAAPESPEVRRAAEALTVALDRAAGIGAIGKPHKRPAISLDSESWREWEEKHVKDRDAGGGSSQAQTITKDIVQSDIKAKTGALTHVSDHPVAIRAAREVGNVLAEMRRKGYEMPEYVTVTHVEGTLRGNTSVIKSVGGGIGKNITSRFLEIMVPENLPDDVSLDDAVVKAFSGDENGVPKYTPRTLQEVVVHEMGHVLCGFRVVDEINEALEKIEMRPDGTGLRFTSKAGGQVSRYARKNGAEFVAEAFVKLYRGETLGKEAAELYKMLKGPEVRS